MECIWVLASKYLVSRVKPRRLHMLPQAQITCLMHPFQLRCSVRTSIAAVHGGCARRSVGVSALFCQRLPHIQSEEHPEEKYRYQNPRKIMVESRTGISYLPVSRMVCCAPLQSGPMLPGHRYGNSPYPALSLNRASPWKPCRSDV